MPPSSYKKEKLILKIYIRLLLYIKDKYNEIKKPDALLQHLTDEINLINQDRALDKTFYDLFTTAAQIELETAKKRELKTVTKIETQEDVKSRMYKYMEKLIDTMKEKGYTHKVDNSQPYIDTLTFPKNLNDLTTLFQVLGEQDKQMQTNYKDADQTTDIGNTMRIIGLLYRKVEIIIEHARMEEDKRKQAGIQAGIQAQRQAKVQAHRLAEKDDADDGDDE